MRRTLTLLSFTAPVVAATVLAAATPAGATPPESRGCQPTFDPVTGLAGAVAYLEEAWDRPLTEDELAMAEMKFELVDRNQDNLICIKIASVAPAPSDPVPQGIDNYLPTS